MTAGFSRPFRFPSAGRGKLGGASYGHDHHQKPSMSSEASRRALRELAQLPAEAEAGADCAARLRAIRPELPRRWSAETARAFNAAASAVYCGGFEGLRNVLGEQDATALQEALGVTVSYAPAQRNAFSERLTQAGRALHARTRRRTVPVVSRSRERRPGCSRRRGSRRTTGSRAGPSDDPDGEPEPRRRGLRTERAGRRP